MDKKLLCTFALSTMFAAACGDDAPAGQKPETKSVLVSAAAGGMVMVSGGTLTIPGGALAADTTITVTSASPASSLPDRSNLNGLTYDFGPSGTTFTAPATLALPITGSVPSGKKAVVSWLDTSTNTWHDESSTTSGGTVSASITHFTLFVIRFNGAAVDCSFTACGGNPVGTWTLAGACVDAAALGLDNCPTASIDVSATGTIDIKSDMTYTVDFTLGASIAATIPMSCLPQGATCSALNGNSTSCTSSGSNCMCTITDNTPNHSTDSGTWSTSGNDLTVTKTGGGTPTVNAYCVNGNSLKIQLIQTDNNKTTTIVLALTK